MKLPKKIRISYADYSVEVTKVLSSDGEFWGGHKSIKILEGLPPNREADVLLHEILHGIYDHKALVDQDPEERVVTSLADGLIQVFKDNKGLLDYFKDRLDA